MDTDRLGSILLNEPPRIFRKALRKASAHLTEEPEKGLCLLHQQADNVLQLFFVRLVEIAGAGTVDVEHATEGMCGIVHRDDDLAA